MYHVLQHNILNTIESNNRLHRMTFAT
jgi:hypothetical protein